MLAIPKDYKNPLEANEFLLWYLTLELFEQFQRCQHDEIRVLRFVKDAQIESTNGRAITPVE